ncbi:MAG TPA: LysM domain-containing protein [Candidatus Limnocylindrales bacterium]|nr:LysM domain-containing protein [Candidatus Limnocylindrales bacterium]
MTPAIVASGVFVAACAVFAVAFVGARGGLEMPLAPTAGPVAAASDAPVVPTTAPPTAAPPTAAPVTPAPTAAPSTAPTIVPPPTAAPTTEPSGAPTVAPPTLEPGDPLLALPTCAGHPACRVYTVVRGDTLSGIISRYLLDIDVLEALNPGGLTDPGLIVTGQVLYLGRDPLARLDPCPNGEPCVLYVVEAGESIAEIAALYLLTRDAVLDANPGLPRPIVEGQVIKLPRLATP